MAEFFEKLDEQAIMSVCQWLAVISIIAGPLIGLFVGALRRLVVHDLLYGVLWGLSGPILAFIWALVDARTSYYDYVNRQYNPGTERLLWKVYDTVGILKPYPVDSVYGLGTLAIAIIVGGAILGFGLAFATGVIDRRFGRKTAGAPPVQR